MDASHFRLPTALLAGFLILGCSGGGGQPREKTYKVTGKVVMGGGPVANAIISFSPKGQQPAAVGRTGTDGQFTLTTYDPGDGAAVGDYVVLVSKDIAPAESTGGPPSGHDPKNPQGFDSSAMHAEQKKKQGGAATSSGLPAKYSDLGKSDLAATVKDSGPNEFNFELKP